MKRKAAKTVTIKRDTLRRIQRERRQFRDESGRAWVEAAEYRSEARTLRALLETIVPNTRRWVEAAHAPNKAAAERALEIAGVVEAEKLVGKDDLSAWDPLRQRREAIERGEKVPPCAHPRWIPQQRQIMQDGKASWRPVDFCMMCGAERVVEGTMVEAP